MIRVNVQAEDFDAAAEFALLANAEAGGIGCFVGIVRSGAARPITALTLEHYPGMTEKAIRTIAAQAAARWDLTGCTIIHRFGRLAPGDNIVFVAAASPHRADALAATAFLIDWLKTAAPFWKREEFADGTQAWVTARDADGDAAARWAAPAANG